MGHMKRFKRSEQVTIQRCSGLLLLCMLVLNAAASSRFFHLSSTQLHIDSALARFTYAFADTAAGLSGDNYGVATHMAHG